MSRISGSENFQLPVAHTCYNQIDLPEYSTKEMLEEKLFWAIKEAQGFGFSWMFEIGYSVKWNKCYKN